jgi:NAD(P)-dependent dehydrogenase (short-subunit alcohol dehydrogenase family)
MGNVLVVIGPGQIGQAIARRVGVDEPVWLADMRPENADAAAAVLENADYEVSVATVDASSREAVQALVNTAKGIGQVTGLSMWPAYPRRRPHRQRALKSICMAPHSAAGAPLDCTYSIHKR